MDELPRVSVDWATGEASVSLGQRLEAAPTRMRHDVLADCKRDIDALLDATEAELWPERRDRVAAEQRKLNARRRELCERLAGQTIAMAEPLVNGDVLLHLASGRAMVLYARHEDVKVELVDDARSARRLANEDGTGDWYVREHVADAQRAMPEPRRTR